MAKESTVRGSGKPLPGATSVTMHIWYQLDKAGPDGLALDQLIPLVESDVPKGYAWRRYVNAYRGRQKAGVSTPDTTTHRQASIRYIINHSLLDMAKRGSAIKRSDGTYIALRKPKSAMVDMVDDDLDGSKTRQEVQIAEALRILIPAVNRLRGLRQQVPTKVEWGAVDRLVVALDRTGRSTPKPLIE